MLSDAASKLRIHAVLEEAVGWGGVGVESGRGRLSMVERGRW